MSWLQRLFGPPEEAQPARAPEEADNRQQAAVAGETWTGFTTWTTDPHIGRAGYYALDDVGYTIKDPPVLLTWVDHNPYDDEATEGHFEVADMDQPYFTHAPKPARGDAVDLEADVRGTGQVNLS